MAEGEVVSILPDDELERPGVPTGEDLTVRGYLPVLYPDLMKPLEEIRVKLEGRDDTAGSVLVEPTEKIRKALIETDEKAAVLTGGDQLGIVVSALVTTEDEGRKKEIFGINAHRVCKIIDNDGTAVWFIKPDDLDGSLGEYNYNLEIAFWGEVAIVHDGLHVAETAEPTELPTDDAVA